MSRCIVYALYDSAKPDVVRYIGQTRVHIMDRLAAHRREAKKARKPTRIQAWVLSVERLGGEVCIRAIDNYATWDVTEVIEIERHRVAGHPLMNVLDGGRDSLTDFRRRKKREATKKRRRTHPDEPKRQERAAS